MLTGLSGVDDSCEVRIARLFPHHHHPSFRSKPPPPYPTQNDFSLAILSSDLANMFTRESLALEDLVDLSIDERKLIDAVDKLTAIMHGIQQESHK